jgi:hypothetical protein
MIAHQTQLHPAQSGRRLVVSDNFYTRHDLVKAILEMTDGETRMLGTVRQDWIGRLNSRAVKVSIERVRTSQRGSWELVAAVDSVADSKKAKDAHTRAQKRLPKNLRTEYSHPSRSLKKLFFFVFHDKQPSYSIRMTWQVHRQLAFSMEQTPKLLPAVMDCSRYRGGLETRRFIGKHSMFQLSLRRTTSL